MERFDKLLLSEMRLLESKTANKENKESQGNLTLAILDNENLKALGYELNYPSIIQLAKDYKANPEMQPLYKRIQELEPGIEVSPMYPGFPTQVLEMSELEYRVHQVIHYMTTYGVEDLLDIEVKEGWLPYDKDTFIERKKDIQVADLKTLEYLSTIEIDKRIIDELIGRPERLRPKELELAQLTMLRTEQKIENIPFKENIGKIYGDILLTGELKEIYKTLNSLYAIIKHPGDLLDVIEYMIKRNKYKHFKTSVKRGLVEILESFPVSSLEENLASNRWSKTFLGKKGKKRTVNRNIAIIDYLSFNRFAKSPDVIQLVNDLKDGNLISWNQTLEKAYKEEKYDEVVKMLSQRPGILFRQVNRLIKLGVDYKYIMKILKDNSADLKTQSIVSAINNYNGVEEVDKVFLSTLVSNFLTKDIEDFRGKNIYIDEKDVDFSKSKICITDKFEGYIRNGLAIKLPEKAKFLRFFTYWNDKQRIDIDLHGIAIDNENNKIHVGWNGQRKGAALVHSGDITHSDASEYIDLNIEQAIKEGVNLVQFNINSYTEVPFNKIDTVFTGLMALSEMGTQVDLFDQKNVIFRHDLEYKSMSIDYGIIDLKNNLLYIDGTPSDKHNDINLNGLPEIKLDILTYINLLILTQGGKIVETKEKADLVIGLAKADQENYVSLIDKNFYMN